MTDEVGDIARCEIDLTHNAIVTFHHVECAAVGRKSHSRRPTEARIGADAIHVAARPAASDGGDAATAEVDLAHMVSGRGDEESHVVVG